MFARGAQNCGRDSNSLSRKFDFIIEVRGEGLMLGMQLSVEGAPYVEEALRRGLLINCTHETTLRVLPPFIITSALVKDFLKRMEVVLAKTRKPQPKPTTKPLSHSSARKGPAGARTLVAAR